MGAMPERAAALLEAALVGELTVIDGHGRPVTYPLIPLWDGEKVYLTSSSLFSRKLEHIRANPRVSLSITDPVAMERNDIEGAKALMAEAGFAVRPSAGTYFVCADVRPLGFTDAEELAWRLPESIGVATVPVSVFTDHPNLGVLARDAYVQSK